MIFQGSGKRKTAEQLGKYFASVFMSLWQKCKTRSNVFESPFLKFHSFLRRYLGRLSLWHLQQTGTDGQNRNFVFSGKEKFLLWEMRTINQVLSFSHDLLCREPAFCYTRIIMKNGFRIVQLFLFFASN